MEAIEPRQRAARLALMCASCVQEPVAVAWYDAIRCTCGGALKRAVVTMPWKLRNLRLTLFFPARAAAEGAMPSWEGLVGRAPETRLGRAGISQEDGPFEAGRLTVVNQNEQRLDLVYAEIQENRNRTSGDYLGDAQAARAVFVALARRALEGPAVNRIAFGCALVHPADTREQAYAFLLKRIATVRFDLDGAREFVYQVNRPRESHVSAHLKVNRVAKWWALQEALVTVGPQGLVTRQDRGLAAQLDLDISTDEDRHEVLPREGLPALLDELMSAGDELAANGDVR